MAQRLKYVATVCGYDMEDLSLFGENMFGVHSIEYDKLGSFFFLFALRQHSTGTC